MQKKKENYKSKDSETGLVVASLADKQNNVCVALKVGLVSGLVPSCYSKTGKIFSRVSSNYARTYKLVKKFIFLKSESWEITDIIIGL